MQYTNYGATGANISRICYGAWAIGGTHYGGADDSQAIAAVRWAWENGVNFFDTAPAYGYGHSEELLARGLAGVPRDQVIIATKWGLRWDSAGKYARDPGRERCREEVEQSLRRLNTDYIDIYMLHWPDNATPVEEAIGAMDELVTEGKIRWVGTSNFDLTLLERAMKVRKVDSLQAPYSILRPSREKELFPFCKKNGIGVMTYGPLQHGLLTGKMTPDWKFKEGDFRATEPHFTGEVFQRNLRIVDGLREVAAAKGKTVAQLAVAWVLANKDVDAAIVGARSVEQLEDTLKAADWELQKDDMGGVRAVLEANQPDLIVTGGLMGCD